MRRAINSGESPCITYPSQREEIRSYYEKAFEEYNQSFRPFIEEVQAGVVDFALGTLIPRTEEAIRKRNKEGFGFLNERIEAEISRPNTLLIKPID